MTSEGIPFENIHEWEHLSISEELFRKKYEASFLAFRCEVQALKDEYQNYLTFTAQSSQTKVRDEENKLDSNRKCVEKYIKDNAQCKQNMERLSAECSRLKKSSEELNERLICLKKEEDLLLEQKSLFALEVKETYNAFLMARSYYKDTLRMYFTLDTLPNSTDRTITLHLFTTKKTKEPKYTMVLQINKSNHETKLLSTNPKISVFEEVNKRLMESGDCSGVICCVRKCFLNMHSSIL